MQGMLRSVQSFITTELLQQCTADLNNNTYQHLHKTKKNASLYLATRFEDKSPLSPQMVVYRQKI